MCVCVCVCVPTAPGVCVCVHCSRCVCVCVSTALGVCVCVSTAPGVCVCVCLHCSKCVCALGWVKYREHISLLVILCIIVYVTNKKIKIILFFFIPIFLRLNIGQSLPITQCKNCPGKISLM